MQIVIEIDNEHYEKIMRIEEGVTVYPTTLALYEAVKNGIPLPKGHGRLIDVKQIVYEKECVYETDGCCTTRSTPDIHATPTIIKADRGGRKNE